MRVSRWITKDRDIISDFVIFTAFPRQKWFQESARTQVLTEEVQMKQRRVQTQRTNRINLHYGNVYVLRLVVL